MAHVWRFSGCHWSGSVADSPSTFQWPPLSGPTRASFPAARSLSSQYRTMDRVVPSVEAISRRLADGFRRRSKRMRSESNADSGDGWPFLAVFWWSSGGLLVVFWLIADCAFPRSRCSTAPPSLCSLASTSGSSITSQRPPLSGPTRRNFPTSLSLSSRYRTLRSVTPASCPGDLAAAGGRVLPQEGEDAVPNFLAVFLADPGFLVVFWLTRVVASDRHRPRQHQSPGPACG